MIFVKMLKRKFRKLRQKNRIIFLLFESHNSIYYSYITHTYSIYIKRNQRKFLISKQFELFLKSVIVIHLNFTFYLL